MQRAEAVATNGGAAAALLAAGVGCFALGLVTIVAEKNSGIDAALRFYGPTGDISGITTVAAVCWLLAWVGLHVQWRRREVPLGKAFAVALVFIALGLGGTFPPVYQTLSRKWGLPWRRRLIGGRGVGTISRLC